MAKPLLRIKAREMRSRGRSVNIIALKLGVSKGTVSLWVRNIILSVDQLEILRRSRIEGGELGRLRGAFTQKQRRLELIEKFNNKGIERFNSISDSQLQIAGTALYWAEGAKKTREVRFCNSDPRLIKFMINWLGTCFDIDQTRLAPKVGINEMHTSREAVVKKHWSRVTGIPLTQFRKTSFKKVKNVKVYANFENHYGTLDIRVLKPGELYYRIMGLIEGLSKAG